MHKLLNPVPRAYLSRCKVPSCFFVCYVLSPHSQFVASISLVERAKCEPCKHSVCVAAESISPAPTTTSGDETVPQMKLPEESAPIDHAVETVSKIAKDAVTTANKEKSDGLVDPAAQLAVKGAKSHGNQNLNAAAIPTEIIPENEATSPNVQSPHSNNNEAIATNAPHLHGSAPTAPRNLVQARGVVNHAQQTPANGNYRNHPAHPIKFVDTLDPKNAKPLDSVQLQEIYANLSSSVTALAVTNNLFSYLTAMLNGASDHLVGDASDAAHVWRWHNIEVLIATMPPFARLLVYKHVFARQVRPLCVVYSSRCHADALQGCDHKMRITLSAVTLRQKCITQMTLRKNASQACTNHS